MSYNTAYTIGGTMQVNPAAFLQSTAELRINTKQFAIKSVIINLYFENIPLQVLVQPENNIDQRFFILIGQNQMPSLSLQNIVAPVGANLNTGGGVALHKFGQYNFEGLIFENVCNVQIYHGNMNLVDVFASWFDIYFDVLILN